MVSSDHDYLAVGYDVGGTFTKAVLIDRSGRVLAKDKVSSNGFGDKTFFARTLRSVAEGLLRQKGLRWSHIRVIGVGLPGPIDFERGMVLSLTNIRGWNRFPLASYLKRFLGIPVLIENDANCMALAEARLGAARGLTHALCVTLGTGVGGGLILGGNIYRGPFFLGGEVGHIPASTGPRCACGGCGCLERLVGNQALLKEVRQVFGRPMSLEQLSLRARQGDRRAKRIWQETGSQIGRTLAGVANVINPQAVVVGGGLSQAGQALWRPMRVHFRTHLMRQLKTKIRIRRAILGNDAGMLGAALLAGEESGMMR